MGLEKVTQPHKTQYTGKAVYQRAQSDINTTTLSDVKTGDTTSWGPVVSVEAMSKVDQKMASTDKSQYVSLSYPSDLDSYGKYHAVEFTVYEVESLDFKKLAEQAPEMVKQAVSGGENFLQSTTNSVNTNGVLNTAKSLTGEVWTALENSVNRIQNTRQGVSKMVRPRADNCKATIRLYMPETINFQYQAQYDKLSLAQAASNVPMVGVVAKAVTSTVSGPAMKLALNRFGYTFNPQSQVTFDGIDFREFDLSFTFTPNSEKESQTVTEIIKAFRMYAAPTVVDEAFGFFFKPPGMFDIKFYSNGEENKHINKVRRSVLTNITVDYSPNQTWAALRNGAPAQSTIVLSFRETELVDRNSIMDEYK